VHETTPTPNIKGKLLAILLAVVTLCETSLGFVHLYPDCNVARLVSLNISWHFGVPYKVITKNGIFALVVPSAGDQRVVDICLTLTSKPRFINPTEMSSASVEADESRITAFRGF
jgi:hypothetical protein